MWREEERATPLPVPPPPVGMGGSSVRAEGDETEANDPDGGDVRLEGDCQHHDTEMEGTRQRRREHAKGK